MSITLKMAKNKKTIPINIPPKLEEVKQWLILGLDPSMSRTGYALMRVRHRDESEGEGSRATWISIGSVKPESSGDPVWARSKAIASFLRDFLNEKTSILSLDRESTGLIVSVEFPTPTNDFLTSINRIIHLVLLEKTLLEKFSHIRILSTNASTLRSVMGLVKTGASNKVENISKAYEFLDKERFPSLDTDSCDAVLMSMMGRHTASILLGQPTEVPDRVKVVLCDSSTFVKGKGRNSKILTKGILWRPAYWAEYTPCNLSLKIRDASSPAKKLNDYKILI